MTTAARAEGEEQDFEGDLGYHRAEEDEGQQHGHLRRGLPVVEEAVAQVEVQERDRQACGEGGQEAVAAQPLRAREGEEHEPYAVERLVLAADAEPGVGPAHQPGPARADDEPDRGAEHEDLGPRTSPIPQRR